MAERRRVNLVDQYLFGNANSKFVRSTADERLGITNAIEREVLRIVRPRLRQIMISVVDDIRKIYNRSGNAYNIMRYEGVRVTGSTFANLRVQIIGPEYLKLLDEGGKIRPKNTKYLAIPLPPQFGGEGARPDGTPKLSSPRAWKNIVKTFVLKAKTTKKLYLAYRVKGEKRPRLLYALVKLVRVTGRKRIAKVYAARRVEMENLLTAEIQRAFFAYVDDPKRHLLAIARIQAGKR
jgi:hypothetical protein